MHLLLLLLLHIVYICICICIAKTTLMYARARIRVLCSNHRCNANHADASPTCCQIDFASRLEDTTPFYMDRADVSCTKCEFFFFG